MLQADLYNDKQKDRNSGLDMVCDIRVRFYYGEHWTFLVNVWQYFFLAGLFFVLMDVFSRIAVTILEKWLKFHAY